MSKAKDLIPGIIEAKTKKEAVEVLHNVLEALYLTNNYTDIVKIKDGLETKEQEYREITDLYIASEKTIEDMIATRTNLNFLYRDISDRFSFDINRLKIYHDEHKTSVRSDSMKFLKNDPESQELFNAKSTSALRDIVGMSGIYKEFVANYSISYGLYKNLETLLNSIKMFIDLLAISIKHEQIILQKDAR